MESLKYFLSIRVLGEESQAARRLPAADRFWNQADNRRDNSDEWDDLTPEGQAEHFKNILGDQLREVLIRELDSNLGGFSEEDFLKEERRRLQSEYDFIEPVLQRVYADWFSSEDQRTKIEALLAARGAARRITVRVGPITYGSLKAPVEILGFEALTSALNEPANAVDAFISLCLNEAALNSLGMRSGQAVVEVKPAPDNATVIRRSTVSRQSNTSLQEENSKEKMGLLWKSIKDAAWFPIILAVVVAGYIVKSYNEIESSRRDWLKSMTDQQNRLMEEQRTQSSELMKEYRTLLDIKRSPSNSNHPTLKSPSPRKQR